MKLINRTELKRIVQKIFYFISPFNHAKCANCRYDGETDAYCKPLLGKCHFKAKVYVHLDGEWVESSNSFADICDDIDEKLRK